MGKERNNSRKRGWVFTSWDVSTTQKVGLLNLTKLGARYVQFQMEKCPETGKKHFQGWVYWTHPKTFSATRTLIKGSRVDHAPYIKEMKGSPEDCQIYCSKGRTRIDGPWEAGEVPVWSKKKKKEIEIVVDPLADKNYFLWQKELIEMLEKPPHDRKIYWYYDTVGGVGKSAFAKHLVMKDPERVLVVGGTHKDAYYAVAQMKEKTGFGPRVVIFDIERSKGNKVSYTGLEGLKNGLFFSSKYESGMVLMNVPHLIVFANVEPEYENLSADRWEITELVGVLLEEVIPEVLHPDPNDVDTLSDVSEILDDIPGLDEELEPDPGEEKWGVGKDDDVVRGPFI